MERAHCLALEVGSGTAMLANVEYGNGAAVGGQSRKWVGNLWVQKLGKPAAIWMACFSEAETSDLRGFRRSRTTEMVAPFLLFLPSGVNSSTK